jgi:hypothetical protein
MFLWPRDRRIKSSLPGMWEDVGREQNCNTLRRGCGDADIEGFTSSHFPRSTAISKVHRLSSQSESV